MADETTPNIDLGAVLLEQAGENVAIISAKMPALRCEVPRRVLEAWCLRKLREEALQPAGTGSTI